MAHIDERKSHSLEIEEVRRAAENIAEDLGEKIGVSYRWEGNDLRFERSGAKGSIHVTEDEVRVQVELGFVLRPMRGKIQSMVKKYLDESLA